VNERNVLLENILRKSYLWIDLDLSNVLRFLNREISWKLLRFVYYTHKDHKNKKLIRIINYYYTNILHRNKVIR